MKARLGRVLHRLVWWAAVALLWWANVAALLVVLAKGSLPWLRRLVWWASFAGVLFLLAEASFTRAGLPRYIQIVVVMTGGCFMFLARSWERTAGIWRHTAYAWQELYNWLADLTGVPRPPTDSS